MNISRRTRDRAAQICGLVANNSPHLYYVVEEFMGWSMKSRSARLAREAFYAANETLPHYSSSTEVAAEAEAMLRTGWSPS